MRFTAYQDYQTILKLNKELINTVIDTPVILYKTHVPQTKTNIYGESISRTNYVGVQVPCLIDRRDAKPTNDIGTLDTEQMSYFSFLRTELETRNIYPEMGDIIEFDSQYYEINNVNEVQLYAGQVIYNHEIRCDAHLLRRVPTNLERPA